MGVLNGNGGILHAFVCLVFDNGLNSLCDLIRKNLDDGIQFRRREMSSGYLLEFRIRDFNLKTLFEGVCK